MAKLSGYLTGQMANPSYGGMLGQNIQGGMQGISDSFAAKKQRQGMDSITQILAQDVSNPQVRDSALSVARQMNIPAPQVQGMIDKARNQQALQQGQVRQDEAAKRAEASAVLQQEQAGRAQEQAVRAQENHVAQQSLNKYNEEQRALAEKQKKITQVAVAAYDKDPETYKKLLEQIPAEFRGEVEQAISRKITLDEQVEAAKEERKKREPMSKERLDQMKTHPEMEDAIAQYELDPTAPGAKARLVRQYEQVTAAAVYTSKKDDGQISEWQYDAAMTVVEQADTWYTGNNINNADKVAIAVRVAQDSKKGIAATVESVRKIAQDIISEREAGAGDDKIIQQFMDANPGSTRQEAEDEARKKGYIK
jgi:hypothetical protein